MKNLYLVLASLIVGSLLGFFLKPAPDVVVQEKVVFKEKIVRRIVRDKAPDGSQREVIDETETRDGSTDRRLEKSSRRFFAGAAIAPVGDFVYQIDIGYRILPNIAVKGSLLRVDSDTVATLGVQVDF